MGSFPSESKLALTESVSSVCLFLTVITKLGFREHIYLFLSVTKIKMSPAIWSPLNIPVLNKSSFPYSKAEFIGGKPKEEKTWKR